MLVTNFLGEGGGLRRQLRVGGGLVLQDALHLVGCGLVGVLVEIAGHDEEGVSRLRPGHAVRVGGRNRLDKPPVGAWYETEMRWTKHSSCSFHTMI